MVSVQLHNVSMAHPVPYTRTTQELIDFPRIAWITQTNMASSYCQILAPTLKGPTTYLVIQKFGSGIPKNLAYALLRNTFAHVALP